MTGCNFAIQPCRLCFTEDSSPSVAPEHRSLSHPRLAPGSPDSRLCRKLSPVEIYYEMRTRRNSASSSVRWAEGEDGMCPPAETGLHYNYNYRFTLQLQLMDVWMFIQPESLTSKKCIQCGGQKCSSYTAVVSHCTNQCSCEVMTFMTISSDICTLWLVRFQRLHRYPNLHLHGQIHRNRTICTNYSKYSLIWTCWVFDDLFNVFYETLC